MLKRKNVKAPLFGDFLSFGISNMGEGILAVLLFGIVRFGWGSMPFRCVFRCANPSGSRVVVRRMTFRPRGAPRVGSWSNSLKRKNVKLPLFGDFPSFRISNMGEGILAVLLFRIERFGWGSRLVCCVFRCANPSTARRG